MTPFYTQYPDLSQRETRVAIVPFTQGHTPVGRYAFIEHYCEETDCDCRRVLIEVVEESTPERHLATINFGWESAAFYAKKLGDDFEAAAEIRAGSLDPLNPQSKLAEPLLALFQQIVRSDQAYVERLARHYDMFKQAINASSITAKSSKTTSPIAAAKVPDTAQSQKLDLDKIDDAVLALLHLTSFTEGKGTFAVTRAWKSHAWDALNRLHEKGLIGDPARKSKSVPLTNEGCRRAAELFQRLFCL
jgi:hypothetical protein